MNTLTRGMSLMQQSGIDARCGRDETEQEIILTIKIPKTNNNAPPARCLFYIKRAGDDRGRKAGRIDRPFFFAGCGPLRHPAQIFSNIQKKCIFTY